jgi:type IX secretion system PorP/SprF family membrane protein
MKTKLHIFLCGIIVLMSLQKVKSQDIHFSQFFETPLLRNPALAGLFTGDVRVQAVYRNQWQSVTVPYQTTSLNGEYKLAVGKTQDYLTIGGQILYDKAGTVSMTATQILPALNYHKSLSADRNMYLSLGFMGGLVQRRIDKSKVTTNSQYDGTNYNGALSDGENITRPSYSYFDGTAGMSFNTQVGDNEDNNVFMGVAYHHFNKPSNLSFYGDNKVTMAPKWVYSGGAKMSTSEYSYFTLQADYVQQGPNTEIIGGAVYTYKLDDPVDPLYLIHGGAILRWKDAIIPVVKLEVRPLSISVSYDANISSLSAASRGKGGFELALSYQKFINRDNTSRDAVRCPRF